MDDSWVAIVQQHWPWLIPIIGVSFILGKIIPWTTQWVWTPLSNLVKRIPQKERERVNAKLTDLETTVVYLQLQIGELRYRDELTWSYILIDQEYHRKLEFSAIDQGWTLPDHTSYMEFRDEWVKTHPMPDTYRL